MYTRAVCHSLILALIQIVTVRTHTIAHMSSDVFADVGTVLHINSVEYTPDGRCLISTVGESRFRTLQHGKRDGYHTASIEFIMDDSVSGEEEIGELSS